MKRCKTCEKELSARNKSGYCVHHKNQHAGAAISAGIRRAYMLDPAKKDAVRARARSLSKDAKVREARRQRAVEKRLWKTGHRHLTPEAHKRGARTRVDRQMDWCPYHLRDTYRALVAKKGILAAEAKALVLDMHAAEQRRQGGAQ